MDKELAKTLTTALVQFIDRERPEGTMCCSNTDCENIRGAFEEGEYEVVESFIQHKLSRLTEFEQEVSDIVEYCKEHGDAVAFDYAKRHAKTLLELAKKELARRDEVITLNNLPPYDKGFQDGKAEALADLERTFECNPDKLPKWLKNKLTKKHLYGYCMGIEDTLREMKDSIESHFNSEKAKEGTYYKEYVMNPKPISTEWGCDGTHCTNPQMDCVNCPRKTTGGMFNTHSGTLTAKVEG